MAKYTIKQCQEKHKYYKSIGDGYMKEIWLGRLLETKIAEMNKIEGE